MDSGAAGARGEGRPRGRGRGRPTKRDALRWQADQELDTIAEELRVADVVAAEPIGAAAADGQMGKAELASRLAITDQAVSDAGDPSLRRVASHPLAAIAGSHASVSSDAALSSQQEHRRVVDFGQKYWGDAFKSLNTSSMYTASMAYGEDRKWLRKTERRMAAVAELSERHSNVEAQVHLFVVFECGAGCALHVALAIRK